MPAKLSDAEVFESFRVGYEDNGFTSIDKYRDNASRLGLVTVPTITRHFTSWNNAVRMLGYNPNPGGRPMGGTENDTGPNLDSKPRRPRCSAHFWNNEDPASGVVYHSGYSMKEALDSRRKHGGDIVRVDFDCATS